VDAAFPDPDGELSIVMGGEPGRLPVQGGTPDLA
jgi:hypothetical protein